MRKITPQVVLIVFLLIFIVPSVGCNQPINRKVVDANRAAAQTLASFHDTTTPDTPKKKYKRSECPVCNGTGKVRTGDGLSWVECDACEPDSPNPNNIPDNVPDNIPDNAPIPFTKPVPIVSPVAEIELEQNQTVTVDGTTYKFKGFDDEEGLKEGNPKSIVAFLKEKKVNLSKVVLLEKEKYEAYVKSNRDFKAGAEAKELAHQTFMDKYNRWRKDYEERQARQARQAERVVTYNESYNSMGAFMGGCGSGGCGSGGCGSSCGGSSCGAGGCGSGGCSSGFGGFRGGFGGFGGRSGGCSSGGCGGGSCGGGGCRGCR